jgi:hypothetical protein
MILSPIQMDFRTQLCLVLNPIISRKKKTSIPRFLLYLIFQSYKSLLDFPWKIRIYCINRVIGRNQVLDSKHKDLFRICQLSKPTFEKLCGRIELCDIIVTYPFLQSLPPLKMCFSSFNFDPSKLHLYAPFYFTVCFFK